MPPWTSPLAGPVLLCWLDPWLPLDQTGVACALESFNVLRLKILEQNWP